MRKTSWLSLIFAVIFTGASYSQTKPDSLKCEFGSQPMGIDVSQPRLSWILHENPSSQGPGYRILVASSTELLDQDEGDLWDSGWIRSDENRAVYSGDSLTSHKLCWWKVWDGTAWSEPSQWTMGVLSAGDWAGAKWIAAPEGQNAVSIAGPRPTYETVLLRGEFSTSAPLKRAVLQVCGLGQYIATINGQAVTDDFLNPAWTMYTKTCLYNTYDVTNLVRQGPNAMGLFLGNGMYLSHHGRYTKVPWQFGPLQAIAVLHLELADGTVKDVITDENWKAHSGPITFSSIYGGEDYDARLEVKGWDQPGTDISSWDKPAVLSGPGGTLRGFCSSSPAVKTFQTFLPVVKNGVSPTRKLYDFGQNTAMVVRLKVHGPAGSVVRMMPAELANGESVNRGSAGGGEAWWKYTLAGTGSTEVYFPRFFYQGARYVQVDLFPAEGSAELPTIESLESVVIHADCEPIGTFSCSNELFNKTYALVRWAQESNMVSVMTDCPTRERLGWLEEDHLNGPALRYNFDLAQLFTKVGQDMTDSQRAEGLVPSTCPDYLNSNGAFADSPEWGSSCILVPWQSYLFENDESILSRNYETMGKYVAFLKSKAKDGLLDYGLSDWYDIGPHGPGQSQLTPKQLSATAFYWEDAQLMGKIALLLHKDDDAKMYQQLADDIRVALNKAEFNPASNEYATGSQCANSMALVMGFADPDKRDAILANIVSDVQAKGLTAGDVGYRYLIRALADGGRSDLLFAINNQSERPGYGMQLKKGATSLTEAWDARGGSSQNHFMLGQINEWFFHDLGGIQPDESGPGFKKIIIKPCVVGDLAFAKTSYKSVQGLIVSNWSLANRELKLEVTVPFGSQATVYLPTSKQEAARIDSGTAQVLPAVPGAAVFSAGPGSYVFSGPALAAPVTGLSLTHNEGTVGLKWNASASMGSYTLRRSEDAIHYAVLAANLSETSYQDSSVTIGKTYHYRVCSADDENGPEVTATVGPENLLINGNFAQPVASTFMYGVDAPGWNFDKSAGITPPSGEMWNGNTEMPLGPQIAFIQFDGTIEQEVNGLQVGKSYTVKFSAAQRVHYNHAGQTWQVKIDDQVIGDFSPPETATTFVEKTITFTATAPKVRLTFQGTNSRGGDNIVFIDDVRVIPN